MKILDESKVIAIADDIRESISALGADSIGIATGEDATGAVIAGYPDKASMEATTERNYDECLQTLFRRRRE